MGDKKILSVADLEKDARDRERLEEFYKKFNEVNAALQEQIRLTNEKNKQLELLGKGGNDHDKRIAEQEAKIRERNKILEEKDALIARQRQEIIDLTRKYEDMITALVEEIKKRKNERLDRHNTIAALMKDCDSLLGRCEKYNK